MSKFISGAVSWVFGVICILIFAVKIWSLNDTVWFLAGKAIGIEKSAVLECISFVFLLAAVVAATVLMYHFFSKRLRKLKNYINSQSPLTLAAAVFCISMAARLMIVLLYQCDFTNHVDMNNAYSFASQIADKGLINENVSYAVRYGRYVNLGLMFAPVLKIFGTSVFTIAGTVSFLFSLSYAAWFDVLRCKIAKSTAFFSSLAMCILLHEICLSNLFLHEMMVYFGATAFSWIVYAIIPRVKSDSLRIVLYAAACLCLALGAVCNPMGYVVAAAFVLASTRELFSQKISVKSFMRFCICCVLVFSTILATSAVFSIIRENLIDENADDEAYGESVVPLGWSLYVGGNYKTDGQWSYEDHARYYIDADEVSEDALYDYQLSLLDERYSEYKSNPLKYGKLLINKIKATYGLNNYQFGLSYGYSQSGAVIEFVHLALYYFVSVPTLLLMAFVVVGAFGKERGKDPLLIFLKSFLCGIFIILLIVETSAKYVSCIWALFVIILALQWIGVRKNMNAISCLLFKKRQRHQ